MTKLYILAGIGALVIAFGFGYSILKAVNGWFDTHELVFNKVVQVEFNKPVEIREREVEVADIVHVVESMPSPKHLETDFDKYVFEVFGVENYKMALAVSKCEGYSHPVDDFSLNTNNTIDVGKFRINSVHFDKDTCSLADVITMKGNVDCAYNIWDGADGEFGNHEGNFDAWVGYWNGCAITKL